MFSSQGGEGGGDGDVEVDQNPETTGKFCGDCGDIVYTTCSVITCKACQDVVFHTVCHSRRPEAEQDFICSDGCRKH